MFRYLIFIICFTALSACVSTSQNQVNLAANSIQLDLAPLNLRVELLKGDKVNHIQDSNPEFSWQLPSNANFSEQLAYQIEIINSKQSFELPLNAEDYVLNTGKVLGSKSIAVSLDNLDLMPASSYLWRVRTWSRATAGDVKSFVSAWSVPQRFTLANKLTELASRYKLVTSEIESKQITKLPSGRYLIDFGKVGFGYLQLGLKSDKAGEIMVHFGERGNSTGAEAGIISNLNKRSSVRYYQVPLQINANLDTYSVHPPRDTRNTLADKAIAIPGQFGRIAPFRFIEIDAQDLDLSEINASMIMLHYPFDELQSNFSSSDKTLDAIWQLCKYSMKATSFAGVYVDGDRERIPYEADAYINQLSHYYVDDEFSLARHSHEYLMQNPTWPTEWKQHSIMMAWADWMHTGDTESLAVFYQQLKTEKTLEIYEAQHGLLETFPKRNKAKQMGDIVDWPPKERDNYQMLPVNTVVNAFYYLNLKQMAQIAKVLGKTQDSNFYQAKAENLYHIFNQKLFDPASGLYLDGLGATHSAVHANILPLAVGLVPENRRSNVISFIKQKGMAVSVYFAQYLMEALYMHGEDEYALSLITSKAERSWYNMIRAGSTITMEAWDDKFKPNQDWNHAWGAVPGNIVGRYILGVQPITAGFESVLIAPQPANLTYVSGKVPTIRGPIAVELTQEVGQSLTLEFNIPGNTTAEVRLPVATKKQLSYVKLNGEVVSVKQVNHSLVITSIGAGQHKIEMSYQ
ncbi:alpha-L-rhamnosidase C-terminal domain-containing protein [Catenovulum maritimum]|uniref:alpha-L-rhamnosidase-related protein n=1 Tax=Catenovulum maritimum TaxID=1513271 RepID=UPI0006609882|nr:alpha-L-rhamnosidase C-terminal domain-containing protein [Catenovulum maritimum]